MKSSSKKYNVWFKHSADKYEGRIEECNSRKEAQAVIDANIADKKENFGNRMRVIELGPVTRLEFLKHDGELNFSIYYWIG